MITEDYVSFETSKLLKEKGFKEWCRCCYGVAVLHNGENISFDEECDLKDEGRENEIEYVEGGTFYYFNCNNGDEDTNVWAAPTLQMVIKWLREVKHYYIQVSIQNDGTYIGYIYRTDGFPYVGWDKRRVKETPEEAYETIIKYCLENLI